MEKTTLNNSSGDAPRLALVAHDARKDEIVEWVGLQQARFSGVQIFSTGTTGSRIKQAYPELDVTCLKSGPLGGDQQIGAMICEEKLDALIFFVDPLSPMPHDVDVKALTRLATVYDLPMACSRSTADLIVKGLIDEDTNVPA
ncbi:methylglyoxal synthase [Ruegeria sp. HKCCD8929]|uniref:methylglyoxal synthase n=1 Tax=Ruegeria sp. HKCCD8929 TaxID=2683006 RepID=UPI00352FF11C